MSEPWSDDPTRLPRDEIVNAIKSLTAGEQTAIMKVARQYARMTPYGAEDLLQEVRFEPQTEEELGQEAYLQSSFFGGSCAASRGNGKGKIIPWMMTSEIKELESAS
jgi:hypothetical protein